MKNKNYRLILYYLSIFIQLIGIIELSPLIVLPFYPEEIHLAYCFLIPGLGALALGWLIRFCLKDVEIIKLTNNYDSILVVCIWLLAILISTVPWLLTGKYNFTQAAFEMTSGFSGTGLTVVDADHCPHLFLMFRSITLFVGGIGLVLILSAAISDRNDLNIYNAEGHNDRLLPNLKRGAQLIFTIYSGYILAGAIAYMIAGLDPFTAINTAIAGLSTGGFCVINASIYGFHSLAIEIISIVLMLLGSTNFLLHYALIKRKYKVLAHNSESRFMALAFVGFTALMMWILLKDHYTDSFLESLRISVFNFFTAITSTGFTSVADLTKLPYGFVNVMTVLMLIGGNMESTSGGIKQYRVVVVLKGIYYQIRDSLSDSSVVNPHHLERFGKRQKLENEEIRRTTTYVLLYLMIFFAGSFIFTLYGYNLQDAMFEFSSCLSTVGLSMGITNFNASGVILWTAMIGMFLGRLEIIIVFQALIRSVKDLTRKDSYSN